MRMILRKNFLIVMWRSKIVCFCVKVVLNSPMNACVIDVKFVVNPIVTSKIPVLRVLMMPMRSIIFLITDEGEIEEEENGN